MNKQTNIDVPCPECGNDLNMTVIQYPFGNGEKVYCKACNIQYTVEAAEHKFVVKKSQ